MADQLTVVKSEPLTVVASEPTAPAAPAQKSGGLGGFLEEATPGLNPIKINQAIQAAFWHPIDTAKGILSAQDKIRQGAHEAFSRGDYATGSRKMLDWALSGFLLPMRLDESADLAQRGEYARSLGAATDVGLAVATPKIVGNIAAAVPSAAEAAAALNRGASSRVVRAIAPQGRSAANMRFGVMAEDVAPTIARQTTARTVSGLADEVGELAATANQKLNAAYAAVPATSPVAMQPVLAGLQRAKQNLMVRGMAPANRAERLASLDQAMQEAQALGPNATIQDLRNLRQAWDEGAEAVFTPITVDNFRTARLAGHGWADARTALDDVMVTAHPELKPLNANVSLWIKAQDVLQAAADVERVRPTVGRSLMSRGLGAAAGGMMGGGPGATLGAILAPSIEAAMTASAPTVKLAAARGMASLADALTTGRIAQANQALLQISAALPAAQRAAWLAQATRLTRDLQPAAAHQGAAGAGASPGGSPP